eukprot:1245777-Pyramimonas_sp.AAC.1
MRRAPLEGSETPNRSAESVATMLTNCPRSQTLSHASVGGTGPHVLANRARRERIYPGCEPIAHVQREYTRGVRGTTRASRGNTGDAALCVD